MCSYNAVNGMPTCADPWLLGTLLRGHWNWTGQDQWVTGDCGALQNVFQDHRYGSSAADAVAKSMRAGTDLDCGNFYPQNLGRAISGGLLDEKVLDESLVRRYASLVRLGYFDAAEGQPYRQLKWKDVATTEARALSLRAATEGIVLLKNRAGALPFPKSVKNVALVGPMANATEQMQGNYFGKARVMSPVSAFQKAGLTVLYAQGVEVSSPSTSGFAAALDAARKADAVVYIGGIDVTVEEEEHDRNNITWPAGQLRLISQLANATAGKPLVVVQMGTMVDSSDLKSNNGVNALLWAGFPGQDGGNAIMNILTGAEAPAGRLPVTQYPANFTKAVPMTDMNLKPGSGNPG